MFIQNLVENTAGAACCTPAHGLSFYIETRRHKILSDLGPGREAIENAARLGIRLQDVDTVILSHGHYDHADGIVPFLQVNSHALIYMRRMADQSYYSFDGREKGYRYIGIAPEILSSERIRMIDSDLEMDEELSLFGDLRKPARPVPATNRYLMIKIGESYERDTFDHEQCLVVREAGKTVLLSGCAHSGILNILDRFQEIYGGAPDVVISGFHLMKKKDYTEEECAEIRDIARELTAVPASFYTCHCTGLPAFDMMKEIMGEQLAYVHCGEAITI